MRENYQKSNKTMRATESKYKKLKMMYERKSFEAQQCISKLQEEIAEKDKRIELLDDFQSNDTEKAAYEDLQRDYNHLKE